MLEKEIVDMEGGERSAELVQVVCGLKKTGRQKALGWIKGGGLVRKGWRMRSMFPS